nr:hypothetical protein [Gemmatimonadota bacterium]
SEAVVVANEAVATSEGAAGAATASSAAAQNAAAAASEKHAVAVAKVPGGARTAANALGILSQVALTGQGSMAGMATAAGGAAAGLATLSASASVAAAASGVGAIITVSVIAYEALKKLNQEAGATSLALTRIGGTSEGQIDKEVEAARKRADDAREEAVRAAVAQKAAVAAAAQAAGGGIVGSLVSTVMEATNAGPAGKALERSQQRNAEYEALIKRQDEFKRREAARQASEKAALVDNAELMQRQAQLAETRNNKQETAITLAVAEGYVQRANADAQAIASRRRYDEKGIELALSQQEQAALAVELDYNERIYQAVRAAAKFQQEKAQRGADIALGAGSDSVKDQYEARMKQIDDEEKAAIRSGVSVETAHAITEQRKQKVQDDTTKKAIANLGTITAAMKASGSAQVRAAGETADAIRRFLILANAKDALVSSYKESAAALGSLAHGDVGGAALHAASALEFGSAAALGFQEAGSGGGSGGSGGGGSSQQAGTFTPRDNSAGGGNVTVILQTQHPASGEVLQETIYQIERAGVLKRPIRPGSFGGLNTGVQVIG